MHDDAQLHWWDAVPSSTKSPSWNSSWGPISGATPAATGEQALNLLAANVNESEPRSASLSLTPSVLLLLPWPLLIDGYNAPSESITTECTPPATNPVHVAVEVGCVIVEPNVGTYPAHGTTEISVSTNIEGGTTEEEAKTTELVGNDGVILPKKATKGKRRSKRRAGKKKGPRLENKLSTYPRITRHRSLHAAATASQTAPKVIDSDTEEAGEHTLWQVAHAGDAVYENRPTDAMYPKGSTNYCRSDPKNGAKIGDSIDNTCTDERTITRYKADFTASAKVEVKEGLAGDELFLCNNISSGSILIEYKFKRIFGRALHRMNESFDRHGVYPDVQAAVPVECAVIDPRNMGNEAQYVNHHCKPMRVCCIFALGRSTLWLLLRYGT